MNAIRFQIISDLHLESPTSMIAYSHFSSPSNFPLLAPNLLLLGDIGLIAHTEPLLTFLRSLLARDQQLQIFYVLGNHESYHTTLKEALAQMDVIESTLNHEFNNRFHVMNQRRIDLNPHLTLLGCTLWTLVPPDHANEVTAKLKDFNREHGIWDRSLLDHNTAHAHDLAWLNAQVSCIEQEQPQRDIVVLTHHSPTIDPRANSPRFSPERPLNSAFRTDLSREKCWMSSRVKVWAFGHTHFSCQYVDVGRVEESRDDGWPALGGSKLVVSNQKGYAYAGGEGNWDLEAVVVGWEDGEWKVVLGGTSRD